MLDHRQRPRIFSDPNLTSAPFGPTWVHSGCNELAGIPHGAPVMVAATKAHGHFFGNRVTEKVGPKMVSKFPRPPTQKSFPTERGATGDLFADLLHNPQRSTV